MSKRVEGDQVQSEPEEPPASVVHQLPGEEGKLERSQFSKEKVLDFIRQVQERPSYYSTHFELDLEKAGLLSELEETGVLPPAGPPIDFESSSRSAQRDPAVKVRENTLKNIYIGTLLGHLFDELFSPK